MEKWQFLWNKVKTFWGNLCTETKFILWWQCRNDFFYFYKIADEFDSLCQSCLKKRKTFPSSWSCLTWTQKKQQHNILPFHEVLLVVLSDALKPFGYRENVGWSLGHVHGETPFHPVKHKSYVNEAQQNLDQTNDCSSITIYNFIKNT